jgi:hypothetical protein
MQRGLSTGLAAVLAIAGCARDSEQGGEAMGIWKAVESENLDAIRSYAQSGGNLEVGARRYGKTPLLHALRLKKKKSYETLLSLGASPNTECRGGGEILPLRTPVIHHAALEEDPFWLAKALEAGGDANLMNNADGNSKLHFLTSGSAYMAMRSTRPRSSRSFRGSRSRGAARENSSLRQAACKDLRRSA